MLKDTYKQRDAEMVKLWNKGYSSRDLAAMLGVTRNVIIGRITRLRLSGVDVVMKQRGTPRKKVLPPLPKSKTVVPQNNRMNIITVPALIAKPLKAKKALPPAPIKIEGQWVLWDDMDNGTCRYINDAKLVCNLKTITNSWCEEHAKICLIPPPPRRNIVPDRKRSYK